MTSLPSVGGLRDSGIGWIGLVPEGWTVVPAKAAFALRNQRSTRDDIHLTPSQRYGVIPQEEYMELTGNKVVLNLTAPDSMRHVEPNDFVIHLRSFQGGIEYSKYRGKVSPAYTVLTPRPGIIPDYFKWVLKSPMYVQALQTTTDQLRDGQSIKYSQFATVPLPLPRPEYQQAVANFLDRETAQIDAMIDAQQRLVDLLEERQAVVQWQTILGQPNRPDQFDSWFGAPPSHWVVDKLGRHARVLNGSTPSRENLDYWSTNGDGHLWLNSSYANADRVFAGDQYVTDVAMQECHLPWLLSGTVLIAITGQGKTRGSVALLETESTINQHLAAIDANRQVWDPRYLTIMLRAAYDELRFISDEAGATKGALTCADLHDFVVPRPSLTEQQDLARAADIATANTRELVERAQDSIGLLRERRAAVITAAVTGRLDPRTGVERVEKMIEGAAP